MENRTLKKIFRSTICTITAGVMLVSGAAITGYAKTPSYNNTALGIVNLEYDAKKQTVTDKNGRGILGCGFDYDVGQDIYFAANYCWQRGFGYSKFYDEMAPVFNMNFYCQRYYFKYSGKDWLIQVWKGQYGITTGGEIGIYYKDPSREIKHFDCSSDKNALKTSLTLYSNGKMLFSRPAQKAWWNTGFILGTQIHPKNLSMNYTITFKDAAMLNAFKKSITKNEKIKYSYSGLTVTCKWSAGKQ